MASGGHLPGPLPAPRSPTTTQPTMQPGTTLRGIHRTGTVPQRTFKSIPSGATGGGANLYTIGILPAQQFVGQPRSGWNLRLGSLAHHHDRPQRIPRTWFLEPGSGRVARPSPFTSVSTWSSARKGLTSSTTTTCSCRKARTMPEAMSCWTRPALQSWIRKEMFNP